MPLLRTDGYRVWLRRRRRLGTDVFPTRLFGRQALVLGGSAEAVRLFYDETRFKRAGAVPLPVRRTLFGSGAVHGLDDAEHALRKSMFLDLLTPEAADEVARVAAREWRALLGDAAGARIELFGAAGRVHCAAVCDWAAVPIEHRYPGLADDLVMLIDGFGSLGPRLVRAARARRRIDGWSSRLIRAVRSGRVTPPPNSALARVSTQRGPDGELLDAKVAGVELVNLLRPTVAVAWFVLFAALALQDNPQLRTRLADGDEQRFEAFADELRRRYPFVPMLGARARLDFEWHGQRFRRGQRVILDVYGTLHDPALWQQPDTFDDDRFRGADPDPYAYIPQGGGPAEGHRCPGERIAIELIKAATTWLCSIDYTVPEQDLRLRLWRMPPRPSRGFVMTDVRPRDTARPSPAAVLG